MYRTPLSILSGTSQLPVKMILAIFLFFTITAEAQQTGIRGNIKDADTHEILTGVNVIEEGLHGTSTDDSGNYWLKLSPGSHLISYSFVGYSSLSKIIRLKAGDSLTLNIFLKHESVNLNTAVVSAGKFRQKLSNITVSMTVIKPDFIQNTNTVNMETAINHIPGVQVMDGQASIRGGGGYSYGAGSRVLVLLDGLPILTADAGQVKWDFLPIENIDQVEIIKGAASALYGSSALNGVINIRTAWPGLRPKTRITLYSGFYDRPARKDLAWWWKSNPWMSGIRFSHSQKIKHTDLVLGADVLKNDGYRQDNFERHLRLDFKVRQRSKRIIGLSYGLNSNIQWQHTSDFFIWQNADSGAFLQMPGTIAPTRAYRFNADPWIEYYDRHNNSHSLRTRYFKVQNRFKDSPDKNSGSEMYYSQYQFHGHFIKQLDLSAGFSALYGNTRSALYGNHQNSSLALYIQANYRWSKRLITSAGFRWEDYRLDQHDNKTAPVLRAGINYQMASYTYLRASFGQGFRFPSVAEKYTATSLGNINIFPNPALKPEKGWSSEIGVKQGFKIRNWTGFLDLAAFWTEYHNMIEFEFGIYKPDSVAIASIHDLGFKSLNIGQAKIQGIDFSVQGTGKLANHLSMRAFAGYTYKNPVDLSLADTVQNNILKYRYRHSAKGDIAFQYKKAEAGISFIYNSFMERIDKAFEDKILGTEIFPGLKTYRQTHDKGNLVLDIRFAYNFPKQIRLSFLVNNLMNREYMGRPGDIRPPRSFILQLKWGLQGKIIHSPSYNN